MRSANPHWHPSHDHHVILSGPPPHDANDDNNVCAFAARKERRRGDPRAAPCGLHDALARARFAALRSRDFSSPEDDEWLELAAKCPAARHNHFWRQGSNKPRSGRGRCTDCVREGAGDHAARRREKARAREALDAARRNGGLARPAAIDDSGCEGGSDGNDAPACAPPQLDAHFTAAAPHPAARFAAAAAPCAAAVAEAATAAAPARGALRSSVKKRMVVRSRARPCAGLSSARTLSCFSDLGVQRVP